MTMLLELVGQAEALTLQHVARSDHDAPQRSGLERHAFSWPFRPPIYDHAWQVRDYKLRHPRLVDAR